MRRAQAAEAAALVALLALAAWLFSGTLGYSANYDEGVYLASLDALRHGQALGKDVFADQPPGFYLLLQVIGAVFGATVHGVRVGMLCVAVAGVGAAYACARAFGGWKAGLAAAAFLTIAAPYPGASVEADPPAVAFSLVALAFAAWSVTRRERPLLAFLAGVATAAAISVKLLALPVIVPVIALLIARRASRRIVLATVAGALVVGLALVGAYADSLHAIYTGVVTVHQHARVIGSHNARRLIHFVDLHTPFGWLTIAGIVLAAALLLRSIRSWWPLWLWTAASVVLLLVQKPLLDHHLVLLAAALALPVGVVIGTWLETQRPVVLAASAVALAALVAAGVYQEHRRIVRNNTPEPAGVTWAADQLAVRTRPPDLVAADLPIVPFLAHRRMPGQLIDTSVGRLGSGFLRPAKVVQLIDDSHVRAVVVGRLFNDYPEILSGLRARFHRHASRAGVTVYFR